MMDIDKNNQIKIQLDDGEMFQTRIITGVHPIFNEQFLFHLDSIQSQKLKIFLLSEDEE